MSDDSLLSILEDEVLTTADDKFAVDDADMLDGDGDGDGDGGLAGDEQVPSHEIFIPVWGPVRVTPREMRIIDHPAMQRLREINQLGFTNVVFPGATHRRFEHALGTLHAVTLMMEAVERNRRVSRADQRPSTSGHWLVDEALSDHERELTRLGALLHDVGHLANGHTFEDELGLLPPHDADARLHLILGKTEWRGQQTVALQTLIDRLYSPEAEAVDPERSASDVVLDLISKDRLTAPSTERFRTAVCRNLIGNTLCADLLDYLHRDWHHIGKLRFPDLRILDYLEVRENHTRIEPPETSRLVLNLRDRGRVRTDAVTAVLDLLESRYQLAEIALFHRTKLNVTAMLERAVAEIAAARAHEQNYFPGLIDSLLGCDDYELLAFLQSQAQQVSADDPDPLVQERLAGAIELLEKIRLRQFHKRIASIYPDVRGGIENEMHIFSGDPDSASHDGKAGGDAGRARRQLALSLEEQFALPVGSFAIYCPRSRMNAKVADVQVLFDGTVKTLAEHEEKSKETLTGGHLDAQKLRFSRLWHMHVTVSSDAYALLHRRKQVRLVEQTLGYVLDPTANQQDGEDLAWAVSRTVPQYEGADVGPLHVGARDRRTPERVEKVTTFPTGKPLITEFLHL